MDLPAVMKLTLKGVQSNETFVGTLFLMNLTSDIAPQPNHAGVLSKDDYQRYKERHDHLRRADPTGASYYIIAVVLVYGMSAVLLIASHINRKNSKTQEDRQINKYLQEFQIVREKSSREKYRRLKSDIMNKLRRGSTSTDRQNSSSYKGIAKLSLLPLSVLGLPTIRESRSHQGNDTRSSTRMLSIPRYSINGSPWRQGFQFSSVENEMEPSSYPPSSRGAAARRHSFVRAHRSMWPNSLRNGNGNSCSTIACSPEELLPLDAVSNYQYGTGEFNQGGNLSVPVDRLSYLRRLSCPFIQSGGGTTGNGNTAETQNYHQINHNDKEQQTEIEQTQILFDRYPFSKIDQRTLRNNFFSNQSSGRRTTINVADFGLNNSINPIRISQTFHAAVHSAASSSLKAADPRRADQQGDTGIRMYGNWLHVPDPDGPPVLTRSDSSQPCTPNPSPRKLLSTSVDGFSADEGLGESQAGFTLAASLTVPSLPGRTVGKADSLDAV